MSDTDHSTAGVRVANVLRVQRKQCATCIYKPRLDWNIAKLESEIADPYMEGHFAGHRVCHHSEDAVCAGFWARHRDDFNLGQVAQRMGFVALVDDDVLR